MPSTLDRYLFRQLAFTTVGITVVLTIAIWLAYSLRFVDFLVNRGLPIATFLYFVVLMLPQFLAIALPIALFVAVVFVTYRLATDRELVVMMGVGLSAFRLARPALVLAAILAAVVGYLNIDLAPRSARSFKDLETAIRNDIITLLSQPGSFQSVVKGVTIYVREQIGDREYTGILIHDARNPNRRITWMAERAAIVSTPEGPRAVLVNGNRQEFDARTGRSSLLYFDQNTIDLGSLTSGAGVRWRDPRERSLHDLFTADAASVGANNVGKFRAEGHQRIADTLQPLTLSLIGLAAMLAGGFSRRAYTVRVVMAALAALSVVAVSLASKAAAGRFPELWPAIYLSLLLPGLAAMAVLEWSWRLKSTPPVSSPDTVSA